jgi:hypothetical protein
MSTSTTKTAVDGRQFNSDVRELRRMAAIALLNSEEVRTGKFKIGDIATALGTCNVTLNKWRRMAETGSLTERKRGVKEVMVVAY